MNSRDVKGLPAINVADGSQVGIVERAFLDPAEKRLVGFAIDTGAGFLSPESGLLADTIEVRSLGPGALTLTTPSPRGGQTSARYGRLVDLETLHGREVVTDGGIALGRVGSSAIDERTFTLSAIEVSAGSFRRPMAIPVGQVVSIGPDVLVVADAVCTAEPEAASAADSAGKPVTGRRPDRGEDQGR